MEEVSNVFPLGGPWNLKRVVQHVFKDAITFKTREAGLTHKDSEWLHKYNQFTDEVMNALSEEDKQKYEGWAKAWSEMGPPVKVKRK